ncbi:hypothetical protein AK88_05619, partial [Plasmodium fragile]
MWNYLILLWDNYIEQGRTKIGVKEDDKFRKLFWNNVGTLWEDFRSYMESTAESTKAQSMCEIGRETDVAKGQMWTAEDMGICEMALIALRFKHGVDLSGNPVRRRHMDEDTEKVDPYMTCILTNIFMKKIMGMNCLKRPGGLWAFNLVHGEVQDVLHQQFGNVECEWKDAGIGGDGSGRDEKDRDLWEVMNRWNEGHKMNLGDGDWGVLGPGCHVEKKAGATLGDGDHSTALTEKVKEEISNVQEDIKVKVSKILKGIGVCSDGDDNCVKKLLEQERDREKNDQDSRSKALGGNGPSQGDVKTSSTARPPRPSRPAAEGGGSQDTKTTSTQAGGSQAGTARTGGNAPATAGNATKPVAAKPATSGTGPGTTSAGGGSGSDGKSGAAAEKGTTTTKQEDCPWKSILEGKSRHVHVLQNYDSDALQKMKTALQAFIDYMQEHTDQMDAYGANCDNSGWDDFDDAHQYKGQTVADVVRCRLMSVALFFANGDNIPRNSRDMDDDKLYERFRCEVANVFGYMLKNQYCKHNPGWKRGVEYAWKTMKNMHKDKDGKIILSGPVMDGRCTQCGYGDNKTQPGIINGDIAEWLVDHGIMEEIGTIEGDMPCEEQWKSYINRKAIEGAPIKKILTPGGIKEMNKVGKHVKEKATRVFEKAKEKVKAEIQTKEKEGGKKPEVPPPKVPEAPTEPIPEKKDENKAPAPSSPSSAGRHDPSTGADGTQPQAPASPVLPARPPPPPPPPPEPARPAEPSEPQGATRAAAPDTNKDSPGSTGKDTPNCTRDLSYESSTNPGLRITISGISPDPVPGCSGTGTTQITTEPAEPAKTSPSVDTTTGNSGDHIPSQKPTASVPSGPNSTPAPDKTHVDGAVVDGGNDDPPPLNPPKPKPNPNPNQSGASGSGSTGQPDASGSSGTGSTGAQNPGSSGPGSAGTGATGTPGTGSSPSGGPSQDNNQQEQPQPPLPSPKPFDPKDLIPYTPAIIPAVVGIGIIAFFLWKYFAYLGQRRRRTYRTIRDVPSPPLDEEILDHLERGDLPPPDYGYAMSRDRQPASISGKGRPPRAHKRTIIELHLEVLNECEVTEWENVKQDYLQIVVEVFARDLERDPIMCSRILDVPTSHAALATHDSTTLHPPTDCAGTDPCPPNEDDPDPWN